MRKCYICQNSTEHKRVTVEREWKGKKIIIEDVPAVECEQCGERYFDAETTLRMEKIKKEAVYPQEQAITIPAYVRNFDRLSNTHE